MKLLFFFPGNPLDHSQGNNTRANALLNYFKSRKITVHLVAESDSNFTEATVNSLKEQKLVDQVFFLPKHKKGGLKYFFQISIPKLFNTLPKPFDRRQLDQQNSFNSILKKDTYSVVLVSYSCWIPLLLNNKFLKGAKTIVDTHDFLTAQFKTHKDFNLGDFFQAEIKLLNSVDEVWSISIEEKYLYEQFIYKPVYLIPHISDKPDLILEEKTIDLLYVASDNEHNIKAINWFFDSVYKTLQKDINITIVGKIVKHIEDLTNVTKLSYVEDLDVLYKKTKVAICPMLSGTGLKIKVVEALSYAIPVVCNARGVDGLINKTENGCLVTNDPLEFGNYITKLLEDTDFYNQHRLKASEFYNTALSKNAIYKKLDGILKSVTLS